MKDRGIIASSLLVLVIIGLVCLTIFYATHLADRIEARLPLSFFAIFETMDQQAAQNTLGSMGEVIAAVLGVAITVVSIVLQLAANRYTPKVTDLFFRSPVNLGVMSLFVVGAFQAIWVGFSVNHDFVPRIGVALALFFLSASLVIMLPYFSYVFNFLRPDSIIRRIGTEISGKLSSLPALTREQRIGACGDLVGSIEQLSEIGLNAIGNRDKTIAIRAIETLREVATHHASTKNDAIMRPEDGRRIFFRDPDLISMPTEVIDGLVGKNVWLEMKVLRQFQMLFNNALGQMVDVDHYLAMQTREIGVRAIERGDTALVNLVVRFFNTFMRASINASSVRTAYNVLHQYREFGEKLVSARDTERVAEVVGHFKYYGLLSLNRKLSFLLETAAYDICALLQKIREVGLQNEGEMLELFLSVDREYEGEELAFEESLRGVRKAQVKLATFYLARGREDLARQIYKDMVNESKVRLSSIKQEMTSVTEKYFWEIIDRGVNLDYLPPDQHAQLESFFGWFEELPAPPRFSRFTSD